MPSRLATDSVGAETINHHATIGVLGCSGRVGSLIVREILARHFGAGVTLAGGTVRSGYPVQGDFYTTDNPEDLFARADVLIDFTNPESTARHMWLAAKHHKPLVIGTTGLLDAQHAEMSDAAKEAPLLYAANMSVGVNLLLALVEQAAARLGPEYDIEIMESHHRHKVDSPSGTALALGKAAQAGRGTGEFVTDSRKGARSAGTIGFAVQRGGDVVGEHDVSFFGPGERLVLSHKATDRALFARGAVRAAVW
ncbi:MAG: 4-hydroxy-tetrahydrodipicolinate reductase, partial [Alphaproteobacteria bacterium]|nr:4-hydroxy-tetrahydrodipicolinate reductase [Alphaproteobacteria bacterium]